MKYKRSIFDWVKISLILEGFIEFLSRVFKIPKNKLWALVDEIQRELLKKGWIDDTVNDYIINTPELLDQRIVRDVDRAIQEFEKIEESPKTFIEESVFYEEPADNSQAQQLLGGPMGIRAKWVDSSKSDTSD